MFKKPFGFSKGSQKVPLKGGESQAYSVEELITLERYDEAIQELELRTKRNPRDTYAHLKLAEVYGLRRMVAKSIDQYLYVVDLYTEEGFYDRALALLVKVSKVAPGDQAVANRIVRINRLKALELSKSHVVQGLLESTADANPLERLSPIEAQQIWQGISGSRLVERLPPEQLHRLMATVAVQDWNPGEVVAEMGSSIERMFLIALGQLEVGLNDPANGKWIQLRTLAPGDLFGERSLLEHRPWPATYRVLERARLLRFDRQSLERALTGNPDPLALLDALRCQQNDRQVAQAVEKLRGAAG